MRTDSRLCGRRATVVAAMAAAVFPFSAGNAAAQSSPSNPEVTVGQALELSIVPPAGRTFDLEVSTNLLDWEPAGTRIFRAAGTRVSTIVPFGDGCTYYRWKEIPEPEGLAPAKLYDTGLLLTQGDSAVHYRFGKGPSGSLTIGEDSTNFLWVWRRTGENTGTFTISGKEGIGEEVQLSYLSAKAGTFIRKRTRAAGAIPLIETGTFVVSARLSSADAPTRIRNCRVVLSDSAGAGCLTFLSERLGVCSNNGPFQFISRRSGRDRKLTIDLALENGLDYEYELAFTTKDSGRFTRRILSEGVLQDEDDGTFSFSRDDRE